MQIRSKMKVFHVASTIELAVFASHALAQLPGELLFLHLSLFGCFCY